MDGKDPKTGRFTLGNRFWEARVSPGRKLPYASGDDLWDACVEYFGWVDENPLHEAFPSSFQGAVTLTPVPKMRAMTIGGLCLFLEIGATTWREWRQHEVLRDACERVEAVIRTQKFEGASAGLLNASIVARDLGLADKHDLSGVVVNIVGADADL